jgi:pimeloyl-ACP methyl ester carboxylesterase
MSSKAVCDGDIVMKMLCALLTVSLWPLTDPAAARGEVFDSDRVKIHYTVQGKGEPVILVHGLSSSAMLNWELPGIAPELAKHYQVIALDNRGHGQSDKPQAEGLYGQQMVEDIVRLMDHLRIPKAHVVGYSMGGMITMKLLTEHPERVRSAILGGMGWLQTGSPLQKFWELVPDRGNQKVPVACLHGLAELAVKEGEVKAVRVPVTIIVGDRDPCRRMYVEPLQRIRPDWPIHIVTDAGHINCILKPDFRAQVKSALDARS